MKERCNEITKTQRTQPWKFFHCFQRLFSIAPTTLNLFVSNEHSSAFKNPSSRLSSSHSLHSSQEPIAICKYLLNSAAAERFAQPSTILAGIDRAERRSCLASSNCSAAGNLRVAREISRASSYDSRKTFRSLYVLMGIAAPHISRRYIITSLLLYFILSHS